MKQFKFKDIPLTISFNNNTYPLYGGWGSLPSGHFLKMWSIERNIDRLKKDPLFEKDLSKKAEMLLLYRRFIPLACKFPVLLDRDLKMVPDEAIEIAADKA